jgi:hypothetical protein
MKLGRNAIAIIIPPICHLWSPLGCSRTSGAYLEKYRAKKKRKMKVGLYGYGPISEANFLRDLSVMTCEAIPYI